MAHKKANGTRTSGREAGSWAGRWVEGRGTEVGERARLETKFAGSLFTLVCPLLLVSQSCNSHSASPFPISPSRRVHAPTSTPHLFASLPLSSFCRFPLYTRVYFPSSWLPVVVRSSQPLPLSPRPLRLPCIGSFPHPLPVPMSPGPPGVHTWFQCPALRSHPPTFLLTSLTLYTPEFLRPRGLQEKHAGLVLKAIPLFSPWQAAFTGTLGTR